MMDDLNTLAGRVEAATGPDWCDKCAGPVWGKSALEIDLAKLAHWVWMHLPDRIAFGMFGYAILPWAGIAAFSCTCQRKNHATRERLGGYEWRPNALPLKDQP